MHRAIALTHERLGSLRALDAVVSGAAPTQADDIRLSGELGGGALLDLGCYAVHALRTLVGREPAVRQARLRRRGSVEACASLEFPGGIQAQLSCAFEDGPFVNDLGAIGTLGELTVRGFMLPQEGGHLAVRVGAQIETHAHPDVTSYEAQLGHVVEVMRGEAPPLTGGADALANMRVLDAIRDAALRESSM